MEAKDTVIHLDEAGVVDSYAKYREVLERQAEISFRAGYDQAVKDSVPIIRKAVSAEGKARIKEVVEWVGCNSLIEFPHGVKVRSVSEPVWQTKLKEWGIE